MSSGEETPHSQRKEALDAAHAKLRLPHRSYLRSWLVSALKRIEPAAAEPLPTVVQGAVALTAIGHASLLIRYARASFVTDPVLSSWASGVKRQKPPSLDISDLATCDAILLSHDHPDHFDKKTLAALPKSIAVVVPRGLGAQVSQLGFTDVRELSSDESTQFGETVITAAAMSHDAPSAGASFVLSGSRPGVGPTLLFVGDSAYFSGFSEIGARYRPDLALLPIGGYVPNRLRKTHMSPLDALQAFEDLGARLLIPIHHGIFALSLEPLTHPELWLRSLARERNIEEFIDWLKPGESQLYYDAAGDDEPVLFESPLSGAQSSDPRDSASASDKPVA